MKIATLSHWTSCLGNRVFFHCIDCRVCGSGREMSWRGMGAGTGSCRINLY